MKMISEKLIRAVKLSDRKSYQIAHAAGIHPSTLSRIVCGIDKVKRGDPRVLAIAQTLGISEDDCFEENNKNERLGKNKAG
jgi:transcriptional regulator with XRE-family HTH domain